MLGCNWLYVRELEMMQSLVTLWKTLKYGVPKAMRDKFEIDEDNLIMTRRARLQIVDSSYRCRVTKYWNNLPGEIRECLTLPNFKIKLKKWIILSRTPIRRN